MRFDQAEKYEIIRIVESSPDGIKRTLKGLGINKSTFYNWYGAFVEKGYDGLAPKQGRRNQVWNKMPQQEKNRIVEIALEKPELSPRELAFYITDTEKRFISESSVYRILKEKGLITSPAYVLIRAGDSFKNKTTGINQMWQTDFTYFKIIGWGWYYLSSILDDFSRYIIAWDLCPTMTAEDVRQTVDKAITHAGLRSKNRPRLLSDNGSCYISKELRNYLKEKGIPQINGKPNHPQTQGKIERYHRSMKNVINLDHYVYPGELKNRLAEFIDFYNNHRYHESLNNVTPADVYFGRAEKIMKERQIIKTKTFIERKLEYRKTKLTLYH